MAGQPSASRRGATKLVIAAPLVYATLANRLSNLFRTRCSDTALISIKLNLHACSNGSPQKSRSLRTSPSKSSISFSFSILCTKPGIVVPVCHQINIVSIVGAHVFERIGKFLSFGEELFKTTEATGHWPAPCVYNFGIGENQLNESNMTKVIGILSMKKGAPAR